VGAPCGRCADCTRVGSGNHPDYLELTPDGATIKIESIRRISSNFAFRAFEGGNRLAVILTADRMTPEAQNALLKTLEEPPSDSTFILVTANPAQLLPTIVSRCQPVAFGPLSESEVIAVLRQRLGFTEDTETVARYSGGSPGRALELLSDPTFRERDELASTFLALITGRRVAVLAFGGLAEVTGSGEGGGEGGRLAQQRERVRAVLEILTILLRDLMLLKAGGEASRLIHASRSAELADVAQQLTWTQLSAIVQALRGADQAVVGNVTPRLVLEALAARTWLSRRESGPGGP
jgi:DNA polymerase-3 subunit delta'